MPRTLMFIDSPELYDAIFHFKNYARECDRLGSLIDKAVPRARTILDVACGTGEHAKFLKQHYAVDGIDINERYLRAARLKNPEGDYIRADMTAFDLGRTYDVVTCLFSAIGADKVYRMSVSVKEGQRSVLLYNYLRGTPDGIEHYSERIELGLFTRDEMTWAFEFSGMEVRYDSQGLMGRGLYVGKHDPAS